jgi:hypothetical protein
MGLVGCATRWFAASSGRTQTKLDLPGACYWIKKDRYEPSGSFPSLLISLSLGDDRASCAARHSVVGTGASPAISIRQGYALPFPSLPILLAESNTQTVWFLYSDLPTILPTDEFRLFFATIIGSAPGS